MGREERATGTNAQWSYGYGASEGRDLIAPFLGAIRNGKVYGLGVLDMKASLAAYVFAVKALMNAGIKLKGKLTLAFVVDEEAGACSPYGTQFLLDQGIVPKACFIGEHGSQYVDSTAWRIQI